MHHSHLCGEGRDDAELIYMQAEWNVCSLMCTSTVVKFGTDLFHMFLDKLEPDTTEGNVRSVTEQCSRVCIHTLLSQVNSVLMSAQVCLGLRSMNLPARQFTGLHVLAHLVMWCMDVAAAANCNRPRAPFQRRDIVY